mmetsp:Transcript_30465/g.81118  ORF Transcript_30465/g.81118 Transcript_30465/m.81118 type:complete len:269 (+) Transcript_30465:737-1543(+)
MVGTSNIDTRANAAGKICHHVRRKSLDEKSDFFSSGGVSRVVKKFQGQNSGDKEAGKFYLVDAVEVGGQLDIPDMQMVKFGMSAHSEAEEASFKCWNRRDFELAASTHQPEPCFESSEGMSAFDTSSSMTSNEAMQHVPISLPFSYVHQDRSEEISLRYCGIDASATNPSYLECFDSTSSLAERRDSVSSSTSGIVYSTVSSLPSDESCPGIMASGRCSQAESWPSSGYGHHKSAQRPPISTYRYTSSQESVHYFRTEGDLLCSLTRR